jgi:hypothetical protein
VCVERAPAKSTRELQSRAPQGAARCPCGTARWRSPRSFLLGDRSSTLLLRVVIAREPRLMPPLAAHSERRVAPSSNARGRGVWNSRISCGPGAPCCGAALPLPLCEAVVGEPVPRQDVVLGRKVARCARGRPMPVMRSGCCCTGRPCAVAALAARIHAAQLCGIGAAPDVKAAAHVAAPAGLAPVMRSGCTSATPRCLRATSRPRRRAGRRGIPGTPYRTGSPAH